MSRSKRLPRSGWLTSILFLQSVLPASAASSWRFWTRADGLSESVIFGLTRAGQGRLQIKFGDVPDSGTFDGYQVTAIASPHALGRLLASPDKELWTFDTQGIKVRDSSGWHTYPDPEIAAFARTGSMSRTPWFMYSVNPGAGEKMDVVPLGSGSGLIMFPDRLI